MEEVIIAKHNRNKFEKEFIVFLSYAILIPHALGIYIPPLPAITLYRLILFLFLALWLTGGLGTEKIIYLIRSESIMKVLIFIYIIVASISAIFSSNLLLAGLGFFNEGYFFVPFLFALGYFYLSDKTNIIKFIKGLMIVALISNLFVFIQYISGKEITISNLLFLPQMPGYTGILEDRGGYLRLSGLLGHPIEMGVYLASYILLFYIASDILKKKIVYGIIITSLICIVLSYSRTPIFVLLMIIILFSFISKSSFRNVLFTIMLVYVVYYAYQLYNSIGYGVGNDSGRLYMLNQEIGFISNNLGFLGIGPTMFRVGKDTSIMDYFGFIDPLANFIDKTIEIGPLFAVSQILIIILMIKRLFSKLNTNDLFIKNYRAILFSIIIVNILVSVTSISLYSEGPVLVTIWLLTGSFFGISRKEFYNS